MFIYILLAVMSVIMFFVLRRVIDRYNNKDYYSLKNEVSRRLYKQHQALPAIHQYPNFINILKALEVKYPDSNSHFFATVGYGSSQYREFRMMGIEYRCQEMRCTHREYHELHSKMNDIKDSVVAQERAMALSGVKHGLDSYEDFIRHAKSEAKLVKEVTRELS